MKITVAGGDARMLYALKYFEEAGFEVTTLGLSREREENFRAIDNSTAVVLPLPCAKGGILNAPMSNVAINIGDIFSRGSEKTLFIGGNLPKLGNNLVDLTTREDFLLKNAYLTAEGGLEIALNSLDISLSGANVIVLGYGRIGRCLANMLRSLHANVTSVSRRSESRAEAEILGIKAIRLNELESALKNADIIFNIIPSRVLGKDELNVIKPEVPIVELASSPFGIDFDYANSIGLNVIKAQALPGKTAPKTAGKIIFETAVSILGERGVLK